VLVLAPSALAEVWARRSDTSRGWFDHTKQSRPGKPLFKLSNFDLRHFSGQDKWNKHDKIFEPSHAFAAKRDIGYSQN